MSFLTDLSAVLISIVYWDMFPYVLSCIVVWSLSRIIRGLIY